MQVKSSSRARAKKNWSSRFGAPFRPSSSLKGCIERSPHLNAETYPRQIYVPDNAAVIASLALHDRLFRAGSPGIAARWTAHARKHLRDPVTGLLVFSISPGGKKPRILENGRGSGAAWSVFYLIHADPVFAREQFALIKRHLKATRLFIATGIKEHPGDDMRSGDIDSGPLIFGLSPSGSGFAVAGARFTGDEEFLQQLLNLTELAGFSVQFAGKRRYLTAPLVGDAIMLAMKSATAWDTRPFQRPRW